MYIRPQLSRKRTENREILSREHISDVSLYEKTLNQGNKFSSDSNKILELMSEISGNEEISESDKKPIMEGLSSVLDELEREYDLEIRNPLTDIEFSMKDRIDEMEVATKKREEDVFKTKRTIWETSSIDKDKLVETTWEIYQRYCTMLENSKSELNVLKKEAAEQRNKIIEKRLKR